MAEDVERDYLKEARAIIARRSAYGGCQIMVPEREHLLALDAVNAGLLAACNKFVAAACAWDAGVDISLCEAVDMAEAAIAAAEPEVMP